MNIIVSFKIPQANYIKECQKIMKASQLSVIFLTITEPISYRPHYVNVKLALEVKELNNLNEQLNDYFFWLCNEFSVSEVEGNEEVLAVLVPGK